MAVKIAFSLAKYVRRLVQLYDQTRDDLALSKRVHQASSGYVRSLLTSESGRYEVARAAFANRLRLEKNGTFIGDGQEYEWALNKVLTELLSAAGFDKLEDETSSGVQAITSRITKFFSKPKTDGKPAARKRLEGLTKSVAMDYASGLCESEGLLRKIVKLSHNHLLDAMMTNKTVGTEALNLCKKYQIVVREPSGRIVDDRIAHSRYFQQFLKAILDAAQPVDLHDD